ncbi:unnamed protein product, partial [Coregonus sp. 'balchen']
CGCSSAGTSGSLEDCDPQTGSCLCLSHVTGRDCGQCEVGFFNLQPGVGCERCNCNPIGSSSTACHQITGQCVCRLGVEGRLCSTCRMGFFGFSSRGCRACNCDPMGSSSMQCHTNGTCPCRQGFVGYKCDQCELSYFHNRATHQCEECPVCYGLVKEQAGRLKARLQDLENLLARFDCRSSYGHQHHVRKYHVRQLHERQHHERGHQGEDSLPNALEDFLAIQEAKEALVKQFALLETSTHTLSAQLHTVTPAMNCSASMEEEQEGEKEEEEEGKEEGRRTLCRTLADSASVVIPFEVPPVPNRWNSAVNQSEVLMKRLADMQQIKENLTAQVNRTLANQLSLEEESADVLDVELSNRTAELAFHVQSKEELVSKIREEMKPRIQTAHNNMAAVEDIYKLTAQAQGSKVTALSSVVTGKEVESEAIALRRELEDMQREWPRRKAQTNAALKKETLLREKVLEDVNKKVNQTERVLRPALDNATLSNATAEQAEHTAHNLSKDAKATLTKAKHARTASAQLSSSVDKALQQLAELENHTAQAQAQLNVEFDHILSETAVRLGVLRGSVESPALSVKIQTLWSAAQDQKSQLTHLEQDLKEIKQERDSLKDIALHLPQTCPQVSGIEGH